MPEIAVRPETMKARPVRGGRDVDGLSRPEPAASLLEIAQQDQRRELGTCRDDQRPSTAVIGLSLRLKAYATSDAAPTAMVTGTSDKSGAHDALQADGEEEADEEMARYVNRTRLASRFSRSPTPTTARPEGVALTPSGGCTDSRISFTVCARSSRVRSP